MIIRKITVAYFSPTGNVKKAALKIGEAAAGVLKKLSAAAFVMQYCSRPVKLQVLRNLIF